MAYEYPVAPVGGIFMCTLRMLWNAQELRNTYAFRVEGNTNNRNIDVFANALHVIFSTAGTGLYDTRKPLMDSSCDTYGVEFQLIHPQRYVAVPRIGPGGGNVAGVVNDLQFITAVLTRRSIEATRAGVSSLYIPLANSDTLSTGGLLLAPAQALLAAHGTAIQAINLLGDGMSVRPIIYHRLTPAVTSYVAATIAHPEVRVMRRRVLGRGI